MCIYIYFSWLFLVHNLIQNCINNTQYSRAHLGQGTDVSRFLEAERAGGPCVRLAQLRPTAHQQANLILVKKHVLLRFCLFDPLSSSNNTKITDVFNTLFFQPEVQQKAPVVRLSAEQLTCVWIVFTFNQMACLPVFQMLRPLFFLLVSNCVLLLIAICLLLFGITIQFCPSLLSVFFILSRCIYTPTLVKEVNSLLPSLYIRLCSEMS